MGLTFSKPEFVYSIKTIYATLPATEPGASSTPIAVLRNRTDNPCMWIVDLPDVGPDRLVDHGITVVWSTTLRIAKSVAALMVEAQPQIAAITQFMREHPNSRVPSELYDALITTMQALPAYKRLRSRHDKAQL
jgi:hypothetical protein